MVSLSIDSPLPSRRQRSSGRGSRLVVSVLALAVALGAGFWLGRKSAERSFSARIGQQTTAGQVASPPGAAAASGAAPANLASSSAPADNPVTHPAARPPAPAGPRLRRVSISGPVADAIAAALPHEERALAEEVTSVVNRLLVWEMNVARDGRRGDKLELLWTPPPEGSPEPVIEAMRYKSLKLGRTIAAYRFQAPGARWPRYYRADGSEVEERIAEAPVQEYEQITSLLRDGRRHKGVDFKMPVGSPVHATFDGVVERRNWNFAGNGNCLDVRDVATGRHAIFLHLDVLPKDVQPGHKVRKGDVIAASGNSGHSFAPHLHYQLESPDGRVLDPFQVQRTERIAVPAAHRPAFEAARAKLDGALSQ